MALCVAAKFCSACWANVLMPGGAVFDSGNWRIILGIYVLPSSNGVNPVDSLILELMANSIMGILYTQSF